MLSNEKNEIECHLLYLTPTTRQQIGFEEHGNIGEEKNAITIMTSLKWEARVRVERDQFSNDGR
jgi:hypothetical protein